jgi:hypothetical protein
MKTRYLRAWSTAVVFTSAASAARGADRQRANPSFLTILSNSALQAEKEKCAAKV